MEKSLQVTVTNPDDLNTLQGELVTQNYNLEILGLKNPADFRKFSKSLMMLDRILKETNYNVDNGLNKKLNKGTYEGDADDLKREIDGKEPAFSKKSGFNKDKTSVFTERDSDKLFTQEGANDLKREVDNKVSKAGDTMTGRLNLLQNSKSSQLIGVRNKSDNGDINDRFLTEQMGINYSGTENAKNCTNIFPYKHNANGILSFNTHGGGHGHMIGFSSNGDVYHKYKGDGYISPWGRILTDRYRGIINSSDNTLNGMGCYRLDINYDGLYRNDIFANLTPESDSNALQIAFDGSDYKSAERSLRVRTIDSSGSKSKWSTLMTRRSLFENVGALTTTNDNSAWNKDSDRVFSMQASNNKMNFWVSDRGNDRNAYIQVGHSDTNYSTILGTLNLNPLGGPVLINGRTVWHSGNFNPDSKITKTVARSGFEGISVSGVSMFFGVGDEISLLSTSGNIHFNYRDVSYTGGGKVVNTYVFSNRKGKIEAGDIYSNGDRVLTKANFSGTAIIWRGSSYSCTVELPSDIQSLDDVLYLQVFGGNDCGTIDGKFLSELSDGTWVRLGYVQGRGTDMSMRVVKVNGRTFKFDQQGTTCTDCADQTFPINYVVVRRIK